ncbi:hypothetical protein [Embleya sp. NPDC020886]|uniref:hypothetical protein n=1 Tax=Embleya sp. NPDC020886 TaxID=3363980 RepID=UPI0037A47E9B
MGEKGNSLRVSETEGEQNTLAEVAIEARTPPNARQELAVNRARTLVADVSNGNRITVRALPTLRPVAEFTTAQPPVGKDGKPELLQFRFLDDDRFLTVSGTRVEYWDARAGRALSQPFDLGDLRLTTRTEPNYAVGPHREPGHLAVTVQGEPVVHAIDLRTGRENEALRVDLGYGLVAAAFLEDARYASVMTTGGMMEVWSAPPGKPAKRVAGPFGPLKENRFVWGATGGSGYFVANLSSVQFLKADDPGYRQSYEFGEDQGFLAAIRDGRALLRSPASGGVLGLVRLDPALWKRHLCNVVGRDLTDDERGSLPDGLPTQLCPS